MYYFLMKGKTIEESMKISVDITVASIKETLKYENIDVENGKIDGCVFSPIDTDRWEQFDFELDGLDFIKVN